MDCFTQRCRVTTIIRFNLVLLAWLWWESLTHIPRKDNFVLRGNVHFGFLDTLWCILYAPGEQVAFCPGESIFWVINQLESLAPGESQLCWLSCLPQSWKTDGVLVRGSGQVGVPLLRQGKNPQPVTWKEEKSSANINPPCTEKYSDTLYKSHFMYLREESFDNLRNCTNKHAY